MNNQAPEWVKYDGRKLCFGDLLMVPMVYISQEGDKGPWGALPNGRTVEIGESILRLAMLEPPDVPPEPEQAATPSEPNPHVYEGGDRVAIVRGGKRHGGFVIREIDEMSSLKYLIESHVDSTVQCWMYPHDIAPDPEGGTNAD